MSYFMFCLMSVEEISTRNLSSGIEINISLNSSGISMSPSTCPISDFNTTDQYRCNFTIVVQSRGCNIVGSWAELKMRQIT